jgi:hypothetical protein
MPLMVGQLDEGLRSEIKGEGGGESRRGVNTLSGSRGRRSGSVGWPEVTRESGNGPPAGEED